MNMQLKIEEVLVHRDALALKISWSTTPPPVVWTPVGYVSLLSRKISGKMVMNARMEAPEYSCD